MYLPSGSNIISGSGMSGSSSRMTTSMEITLSPTMSSSRVEPTNKPYNESMQDAITVFCLVLIIIVLCMCFCFFCARND